MLLAVCVLERATHITFTQAGGAKSKPNLHNSRQKWAAVPASVDDGQHSVVRNTTHADVSLMPLPSF